MMKMMSGVVASFGVVTAGEQGRVNNRGGDFGNFFLLMQLMTMMCDGELGCNRGMRAAVGDREGTRLQSWWGDFACARERSGITKRSGPNEDKI